MLTKLALLVTVLVILNRNPLTYIFHEYSVVFGGIGIFFCLACLFIDFTILNKKNNKNHSKLNIFDFLLFAFLIYILTRSIFTLELDRSFIGILLYGGFVPAYFIARTLKFSLKEIFYVILFCFLYLTLFGYLQWMFAIPFGEMQMATPPSFSRFYPMRITSTLGSSLHFGIIYTLILTFLNSKFLISNKIAKKTTLFIILLNLIALPLIIGTYSRGAVLLYLVCTFLLLINLPRSLKNRLLSGLLALSLFLFLFLYFEFPDYLEITIIRFLSTFHISESSNVGRIYRYNVIFSFLIENPLWIIFGVGPGHTGNIVRLFGMESIFKEQLWEQAVATESYPLKLLLEIGIIGLTLFYLIFFLAIKKNLVFFKIPQNTQKNWLYLGMFSALAGIFIHSLTLQSLEIPGVAFLFWFLIGLTQKRNH